MLTQEFDLKIIPDSGPVVVHVNQYDTGIGRFVIHLLDVDDTPYSPTDAVVMIQGTKPDKHGFAYTATISSSTVTADVTEQMTAVEGIVRTQIIVTDAQGVTGTFVFHMDVQRSALQDDTDISETELPAIIDLARKNAREAAESAAAAHLSEENAKDSEDAAAESEENAATSESNAAQSESNAEAWAVGERDGQVVPSTDPTYENNSRYYAGLAEDSEDNALESERKAKASEQAAKASEEILQYYVDFVIPRFIIQNNRLYISTVAEGEFIVANNRLYIKNAS